MWDQVNASGKEYGMRMNSKKTKIMKKTRNNPTKFEIKIDGNDIEQVSRFVYRGQLLTEDGKSEKDIKRRISISRDVFNKMRKLLCNRDTGDMGLITRKRILRCYVLTTLLYGAETWTFTKGC